MLDAKIVDEKSDEINEDQNQLLKIVKDMTSKGFLRNNYKKNLVDLSSGAYGVAAASLNYFNKGIFSYSSQKSKIVLQKIFNLPVLLLGLQ